MTLGLRIAFQTEMRAASVAFLKDYAAAIMLPLQVYPGRPATLHPPTAFVDRLVESIAYTGLHERNVQADMIVLHGLFDSKDAVDQKDAFVDGLIDYAMDHYHQAGANTLVAVVATEDDPNYSPDWIRTNGPPPVYYATRITLEGRTAGG